MILHWKRPEPCLALVILLLLIVFYPIGMRGDKVQTLLAYDHQFEEEFTEVEIYRGINIGNALEAPNEGEWGVYIQDEYFRIIREAGFDTVRIPVKWSAHAAKNPPYRIDEGFFNRVDHLVNKSLEQDLITIINIHHYEEIMQNPMEHKERFLSLWSQISDHYKDYSEKLYFELLNEPCEKLTSNLWNEFLQEAIKIMRETNPTRKIIVGPVDWNSVYRLKDLEISWDDKNIIVTFHFYTPFEFTHQGAEWVNPSPPTGRKWIGTAVERNQITRELDIAAEWSKQHSNITLLMGEFGAYSRADMDSRVRWTYFVAREAEKRGIAWCYWEFCSGFGAYDSVRKEWREELLNALISEDLGDNYVSVDSRYGSFSGIGWYKKGSYAIIRAQETVVGFLIRDIFDHFEGLGPQDRIIDERTVEVYVDGPREIKVVWRKDYSILLLLIGVICACLIVRPLYKRLRPSG